MINYHPDPQLLQAYAAADLPCSLALAVAAHVQLCSGCAARIARCEAQLARELFDREAEPFPADRWGPMLQAILSTPRPERTAAPSAGPCLRLEARDFMLPRALAHLGPLHWRQLGRLRQARVALGEAGHRASLLYLGPGGRIPEHAHQGFELTLVLSGRLVDEAGGYGPGDFLWRQGEEAHSPGTPDGCLCYAVLDAPVRFTRGVSRLLNGVGNLLY